MLLGGSASSWMLQNLAPLMLGEDYPPYKNGLPRYVRLKNVGVKKKLGEFKV